MKSKKTFDVMYGMKHSWRPSLASICLFLFLMFDRPAGFLGRVYWSIFFVFFLGFLMFFLLYAFHGSDRDSEI